MIGTRSTLVLLCLAILPAPAANFTVTKTTDDGTTGTLRFELGAANASPGNTVNFDPTVFHAPTTVTLTSGVIEISQSMTITNTTGNAITISGGNSSPIFLVDSLPTVTLDHLIMANGNAGNSSGGGIQNNGNLTVTHCVLSNNSAGGGGGGIFNNGVATLMVDHSTLSNNSASSNNSSITADGGGILIYGGSVTITNSTLSGNSASGFGGGIANEGGYLTVNNSTLAGNSAPPMQGGAIANFLFSLTLQGTLLANQTGGNCDVSFSDTSNGYNLADDNSCTFLSTNDIITSPGQAGISTLANNGGPTPTVALLTGSRAIDAIPMATGNCPNDDQRGVTRPDNGGKSCDIGAYEFQAPTTTAITVTIEIKPGSNPPAINPKSNGSIPVAILSGNGLNAVTDIDQSTLRFGHSGTENSLSFCDAGGQLVNGVLALVCHFDNQLANFQAGDTTGFLTGKTLKGTILHGSEAIQIVGAH